MLKQRHGDRAEAAGDLPQDAEPRRDGRERHAHPDRCGEPLRSAFRYFM
jgi:hypothetical protein